MVKEEVEGEEEEEAGSDVGSSDDGSDGLAVNRMNGEEKRCQEGTLEWHEASARAAKQGRDRRVEQDIDEVISKWPQLVQPVIEAERENGQRTIRFVAARVMHRSSPKVVEPEI